MVLVVIPGPNLAQPGAVAARGATQFLLDACVDENAVHRRLGCRRLQHLFMAVVPQPVVQPVAGLAEHVEGADVGTGAVGAQVQTRAEVEPHIRVDAGLVAAVAERHRAAAGHAEIADMHHAQPLGGAVAQRPDAADQRGVAVIAIALQVHDDIAVTLGGQLSGAQQTAGAGVADGSGRPGGRAVHLSPGIGQGRGAA